MRVSHHLMNARLPLHVLLYIGVLSCFFFVYHLNGYLRTNMHTCTYFCFVVFAKNQQKFTQRHFALYRK